MNESAVKGFAVWARRELLRGVAARMARWDIGVGNTSAMSVASVASAVPATPVSSAASAALAAPVAPANAEVIRGKFLTSEQRRQRAVLLEACARDGADAVCEKAASAWFVRFAAVRYMELRDYLPCRMRMFSSADGSFNPQVLSEALDASIENLDAAEVIRLVREGDNEALFRCLFLAQCHELSTSMPTVFAPAGDAFDLLLPDGLLRKGGVLEQLVNVIPESDWLEGASMMGWFYQAYASERKDEVFDGFKKGRKVGAADIAFATQVFTPDWLARYLVQNSLGRLWMECYPESGLLDRMDFYISPALGLAEAREGFAGAIGQLDAGTRRAGSQHVDSRRVGSLELDDIAVCDPACGSGRILAYAFDVLMVLYEEAGYTKRDAVRCILERNLVGFEIDSRAAALASFVLTMKAMEHDARFLRRGVVPCVVLLESVEFSDDELARVPSLAARRQLVDALACLGERGSLVRPDEADLWALADARREAESAGDAGSGVCADAGIDVASGSDSTLTANVSVGAWARTNLDALVRKLAYAEDVLRELRRSFSCVVSYPPYMAARNLGAPLSRYLKDEYPLSCQNLGTAFLERGLAFNAGAGYTAIIVSENWMFSKRFQDMRKQFLEGRLVSSVLHVGSGGFDNFPVNLMTAIAIVLDASGRASAGCYVDVTEEVGEREKSTALVHALENPAGRVFIKDYDFFECVPNFLLNYRVSDALLATFRMGKPVAEVAQAMDAGVSTGDNKRFLRYWYEVGGSEFSGTAERVRFSYESGAGANGGSGAPLKVDERFGYGAGGCSGGHYGESERAPKWRPYSKGGEFRAWYGNLDYVIERPVESETVRRCKEEVLSCEGHSDGLRITWSKLCSTALSFRRCAQGSISAEAGPCLVFSASEREEFVYALFAFLNSSVARAAGDLLCPTLSKFPSDIGKLPVADAVLVNVRAAHLARDSVCLSRLDWDSFETSWDFERNPLV